MHMCIDIFDFLMRQFRNTTSKYGGLYRTFYDMCSIQYSFENPRPSSAKVKINRQFRLDSINSCEKKRYITNGS